jgi:hypothetical protein
VKNLTIAVVLVAAFASSVRADVGFHTGSYPRWLSVPPRNAVPIVVEVGNDLREPHLVVPKKLTSQAIPAGSTGGPHRVGAVSLPLLAGSALALTIGGLWLTRTTRFRGMAMLALAAAALGGAILIAHPPPPTPPPFMYDTLPPLDGVVVELTNDGDEIRLQLPRDVAVDLAEKLTARGWPR